MPHIFLSFCTLPLLIYSPICSPRPLSPSSILLSSLGGFCWRGALDIKQNASEIMHTVSGKTLNLYTYCQWKARSRTSPRPGHYLNIQGKTKGNSSTFYLCWARGEGTEKMLPFDSMEKHGQSIWKWYQEAEAFHVVFLTSVATKKVNGTQTFGGDTSQMRVKNSTDGSMCSDLGSSLTGWASVGGFQPLGSSISPWRQGGAMRLVLFNSLPIRSRKLLQT